MNLIHTATLKLLGKQLYRTALLEMENYFEYLEFTSTP